MPIYEYKCNNCGNIQEFLVMDGIETDIICANCGSRDMEKVLSTTSLFMSSNAPHLSGKTCCGRDERCDSPPCSTGGRCKRDRL